jgi:hypothetical protein
VEPLIKGPAATIMTTLAHTQITASANTNLGVIEAMRAGSRALPPIRRQDEMRSRQ